MCACGECTHISCFDFAGALNYSYSDSPHRFRYIRHSHQIAHCDAPHLVYYMTDTCVFPAALSNTHTQKTTTPTTDWARMLGTLFAETKFIIWHKLAYASCNRVAVIVDGVWNQFLVHIHLRTVWGVCWKLQCVANHHIFPENPFVVNLCWIRVWAARIAW